MRSVVQAVSAKYGNDSFRIIYVPAYVIAPKIGATVTTYHINCMVSNGYSVTILPAEETNE